MCEECKGFVIRGGNMRYVWCGSMRRWCEKVVKEEREV